MTRTFDQGTAAPRTTAHFLVKLLIAIVAGILSAMVLARAIGVFFFVCWISALISAGIAWVLTRFPRRSRSQQVTPLPALTRWLGISLAFTFVLLLLTLGPLNIDRSFSVWMLRELNSSGSMSVAQTETKAESFFVHGSGEIQRRISEQTRLGNIQITDGIVTLTPAGRRLALVNKWISISFGLNPRYAQG